MNDITDTYRDAASDLAVSVVRMIDDSPEIAAALLTDDIVAQRVAQFRTAFASLWVISPCNAPRLWAENPAPRCQRTAGHTGGHTALTPDGLVSWASAKAVSA